MAKTYSEKLKHPRWQKKRLEIFNRDQFTCQFCGDKETTLAVHHKNYINGKEPWDYEDKFLITVCENCHKIEYQEWPVNSNELLYYIKMAGFSSLNISPIISGFAGIKSNYPKQDISRAVGFILNSEEFQKQAMDCYYKFEQDILESWRNEIE